MANCQTNLADIKLCTDSAGGNASGIVKTLKVAFLGHVATIPAATAGVISGDITMIADTRPIADQGTGTATPGLFYDIDCREEGLLYTTEEDGDAADGNMIHTITGRIPKMSAAKNHILDSLRGGNEHLVIFTDRNRFTQLMGDSFEGATFSVLPTTDGNGYNITIRWRAARFLYGYTGAVPQA